MNQYQEFLRRRKDRICAITLSAVEREVPDGETRDRLRKVILDQINNFYNEAIDVIHSLDPGTVVLNQLYLERLEGKLEDIHELVLQNGKHG
jgi:hypothetical protein